MNDLITGQDKTMKEPRQPVYILIDRSEAMTSKLIISARHRVKNLVRYLKRIEGDRIQIAIITFGSSADLAAPLCDLCDFRYPLVNTDSQPGIDMRRALKILISELEREYGPQSQFFNYKACIIVLSSQKPTSAIYREAERLRKQMDVTPPIVVTARSVAADFRDLTDKVFIDGSFALPLEQLRLYEEIGDEQSAPRVPADSGLMQALARQEAHALLLLTPREYSGPITITRPVTLDGQGATLWALKGPVLIIQSEGVTIKNMKIEVTGEPISQEPRHQSALVIRGCRPVFDRVEVRGNVIGLREEEGIWQYPHSLHLGHLPCGKSHRFRIRIGVPVPCRLSSAIAAMEIIPSQLSPGLNDVSIALDQLSQDTLIYGTIALSSGLLKRNIYVSAHILPQEQLPAPSEFLENGLVWEPGPAPR